ncbi:transposable element Tcb1 transposase [Trichonephila clavipes]|nr:transposable element Tcb1 transposase [Trichonephila clavipes]
MSRLEILLGFTAEPFLVRMAGTLNGQVYISEVLEPVVLPYIQRLPSAIFQEYYVMPDVACNVQDFLFTHQIKLVPWPACSPVLSTIENVWYMLSQRLAQDTHKVKLKRNER